MSDPEQAEIAAAGVSVGPGVDSRSGAESETACALRTLSTTSGKIMAIERLRGVAIIMVYLIHVPLYGDAFGVFRPLAGLGTWAGVDLFFVISGFVMTLSLEKLLPPRAATSPRAPHGERAAPAMRTFYTRRAFRLAPIAFVAILMHLVGSTVGPLVAPGSPFLTPRSWAMETLAIGTGLYNFVAPHLDHPAMAFFWSLSVEEQFYLVIPVLFMLTRIKSHKNLHILF